MNFDDFVCAKVICLPRKAKDCFSSIWGRTKSYLRGSNGEQPEVTWTEVTSVTWQEVTLSGSMFCVCATGSCAISALVGPFHRKGQSHVTGRALTRSLFCACPAFSRAFFLSNSTMITGCDQRSLDRFGVPLGGRNRKLCNTGSSSKQCWLGCFLRRPRLIFSRASGTKHPRPIFSYWN